MSQQDAHKRADSLLDLIYVAYDLAQTEQDIDAQTKDELVYGLELTVASLLRWRSEIKLL